MNRTQLILCALGIAGFTGISTQAAPVETPGFLKYEVWFPPLRDSALTGGAVSFLTADPNYPATPDATSYASAWDNRTVFPDDSHEQYGDRITGWLTPTVTGDYNFFSRADDASELWISTDSTPANLALVAAGGNASFLEPGAAQTTVTPLHLVAGTKYWVQSLHKESTYTDFLEVAWRIVGNTTPAARLTPIMGTMLSSMADPTGASLTITQQPQATSTPENTTVTFSVVATAVTPYLEYTGTGIDSNGQPLQGGTAPLGTASQIGTFYQWFTNGVAVQGANGMNYTIPWPKQAVDGGNKVKCYVAVPGVPTYSSEVTLTVTADTTPPTITHATSDVTFTHVFVTFSEPVTDTALNASNYTLDQGITVSSVTRLDLLNVQLTTGKLVEHTTYNLTVNGVQDTATPANTIAAGTKVQFGSFVFVPGALLHKFYSGITGNTNTDLFNDPRYANNPTFASIEPAFEFPPNGNRGFADNYDNTLETCFIPPTTDNYVFFICGHNNSWLYLSTDDNPANMHLIAQEIGWSDQRRWVSAGDINEDVSAKRSDAFWGTAWPGGYTISLTAGKRYYMLGVHHDPISSELYDQFCGTYKNENDLDPVDLTPPALTGSVVGYYLDPNSSSVSFVQQPTNVTGLTYKTATFSALATHTSAYTSGYGTGAYKGPYGQGPAGSSLYQWQAEPSGGSIWTNIAGANASSYTTPYLAMSDSGTKYQLIVTVPTVSATSQVATLTVIPDTVPPVLVSAAAINSGSVMVGLAFNERLDKASAETAANYTVSGATVTAATLHFDKFVALTLSGAINAAPSVTINNVKNLAGVAISATTVTAPLSTMTDMDVGTVGTDPLQAGYACPYGTNAWLVAGGGSDMWGTADEFHFVYQSFTGPFDLRMRLQAINTKWTNTDGTVNGNDGNYAKAALMVRESTAAGSRDNYVQIERPDGDNWVVPSWRDTTSGAMGNTRSLATESPVIILTNVDGTSYTAPEMWVRLVRTNDTTGTITSTVTLYCSADGVNWNLLAPPYSHTTPAPDGVNDTTAFPSTVLVGIGINRQNNTIIGPMAEALVDNYSAQTYSPVVNPQLTVSIDATGKVTITWAAGTLVGSSSVHGTYAPITGATSPYVVTPTSGTTMFYQVTQ
jgi:hypothetical protein